MEIKDIKCPNCAGKLIRVNIAKKVCPFCDAEFVIELSKTDESKALLGAAGLAQDICVRSDISGTSVYIGLTK